MKKLNFGCGKDIRKGYINVDIVKLDGVDIVCDLNKQPYPFADEEFDEIYADNVLEHLDNFIDVMRELHRILKGGGKLIVKVPHFLSHDAWSHPQHTREFTIETFDFFVRGTKRHKIDGRCFDFSFSRIRRKIIFEKGRNPINWYQYPYEFLINFFPEFYERTFFRIIPCSHIVVELIK